MSGATNTATSGMATIAALATPPGTAGLAVIRISGDDALRCTAAVFHGKDLASVPTHTAHYGSVRDAAGTLIDEVIATVFRAPRSYTGEDSVEISCHGGSAVTRGVLAALLETGARHAEPGEFTRRAFLNGRMDLVQAEAVADLIHAQSRDAHRASMEQLEGALSAHVREIREKLMHAASMLELSLDFVEEDVSFLSAEELLELVREADRSIGTALDSFGTGRLVREGVRVALMGLPNVGKSSLLNALLETDRAIVTDIPGTTRDFIEEPLLLRGQLFRFIDTAGLRSTGDIVEREGIARTHAIMREADIVCMLSEATEGQRGHDALSELFPAFRPEQEVLRLYTKSDLIDAGLRDVLPGAGIPVSVRDKVLLDQLRDRLSEIGRDMCRPTEQARILVTNARHADCLRKGRAALQRAVAALGAGRTEEFVAIDVREAIEALGEMIGEVTSDDVLNGIFSRFCIGK